MASNSFIAERLDAILADAARREPTFLDFLDHVLRQEVKAKPRKRVAMGVQIAHFPSVKMLDDFEFKFQPSIDQADRLLFDTRPKLLVIDELGYLPFERRSAPLFFN